MTTHVPVLIYDGDCGVCNASARVLRRLGCNSNMMPWSPETGVDASVAAHFVVWIDAGGRQHLGAVAAALCLRSSDFRITRFAGWLLMFPLRPLAMLVYPLIEKNRHRISKLLGLDACKLDD